MNLKLIHFKILAMKKTINHSIILTLISVVMLSPVYSQGIAMNNKINEKEIYTSATADANREIKHVNEVNSKVLRSFSKTFGEKPGAKWFRTDNGFAVSFKNEQINTNVYYKTSGSIEYQINYYFEGQMPADVRHLIKSNFYDYTIVQVSEVVKDNTTGYFVKVEDKSSIKTIRVIGEEYEVIETLIKK
jgi:hypothetical protein